MTKDDTLRGMALVALATLVFACMDSTTKHLAASWNVPLVVAMRYLVNLILLTAIFAPRQGMALVRTRRTGLVLLRSASLALASLFAGLAFQRMPVAEATSIIFLAPFGVMLLSGWLLGERAGRADWLAAAVGFFGMLLIVRPGSGLDPVGVLCVMGTAAATVCYNLLSRVLARSETTEVLMFWSALAGALVFGATLPWSLHGPVPGAFDAALFIALGGLAVAGHFQFTAAFRFAPASALAPVNYLHLAWAGVLGWLVFRHVPDAVTLLGIALVAGAGVGAALYAHWQRHIGKAAA
jgi:drug/metabolite transporter (DMT)-like permease